MMTVIRVADVIKSFLSSRFLCEEGYGTGKEYVRVLCNCRNQKGGLSSVG